jgi:hypothetical protein
MERAVAEAVEKFGRIDYAAYDITADSSLKSKLSNLALEILLV